MPISAGAKLGHYEILAPLGAGGMGQVFRARDTRLDRDVAVKVLPPALAHDRERLARLEREAKVLASLNHPNVAQIYGYEESDGVRALVMELVAGTTLPVPLPLEKALEYARQTAEALEAAHEKGITHRDLKPANIMVTPEGVVKVLDFGLASAPRQESNNDPADSPTLTMDATQAGMIMGTAQYMSPEQAAGKIVDKRSDVWSFGVVLYEMLSGVKLFDGETISHTLADVLRAPIDLSKLPGSTPPPVLELIKRCLDRELKTRLRDIGEARIAIQRWQANPLPEPAKAAPASRRAALLPWGVACAAVVLSVTGFLLWKPAPANTNQYILSVVPEGLEPGTPAVSPDGKWLAFIGYKRTAKGELWLRNLESEEIRLVPDSDGVTTLFWSPDSRSIGFFGGGKLRRADAAGGRALFICDGTGSGTWSRDGMIVFAPLDKEGVYQVSATGGTPQLILPLEPARKERKLRVPSFLPDGRHYLVLAVNLFQQDSVLYAAKLGSHERTKVASIASNVQFVPSQPGSREGRLLFVRGGSLFAQPFDSKERKVTGDPSVVADRVLSTSYTAYVNADFSASDNGVLAYRRPFSRTVQLAWYGRDGKPEGPAAEPGRYMSPRLSPNGKQLFAGTFREGAFGLDVIDLASGAAKRIVSEGNTNPGPWSPSGDKLVYTSRRDNRTTIYAITADGGGAPEKLFETERARAVDWSPDGRSLAIEVGGIEILPLTGDRKPSVFAQWSIEDREPRFSPDGKWIAYSSRLSSGYQIYVSPFPGGQSEGKWQVSIGGGMEPRWSGDGKQLFFISPDLQMMAVDIAPGQTFRAGTPRKLFSTAKSGRRLGTSGYEVSAGGKRFLMMDTLEDSQTQPIEVIVNWRAKR